jgi:CRISPR-associated protein Cmr2
MSYLMIIGIGPVQEFIASARRSRDLWFGSWLLSELSKSAAHALVTIHAQDRSRLIFPAIEKLTDLQAGSEFNVVNKIVALIDDPELASKAIWQAMQTRLDGIRQKAYGEIRGKFDTDKAERQVADLIEFFWAATGLENPQDANEYQLARKKAEYLFAARKTTRSFEKVTWGENVPKSSLDGQRESVINENIYKTMRKEELWKLYNVRQGERLCGVGLLKRHGNRRGDSSFFSTSHVAALPLLQRLSAENEADVEDYVRTISALLGEIEKKDLQKIIGHIPRELSHPIFKDYDGRLLFEERLSESFSDKQNLQAAKNALGKFREAAFAKKKPLPYYALLLADGDHMGKAIDAQKDIESHRRLSGKLSEFAKEVRAIVEGRHSGSLVYSGGDDVLAFVPLHTVLACAKELAERFKEQLEGFQEEESRPPTLSVGVAVAHHLEPLSDTLELARQAEKAAKAVEGKDALAVVVDKRSGVSRIAKGKWGTFDTRLQKFVEWHCGDALPDNAAYQLRDLAIRLESSKVTSDIERKTLEKAKQAEAIRILKRKRAERGQESIKQDIHDALTHWLKDEALSAEDNQLRISVAELADEIIIAKVFADAVNLAKITETQNG